MQLQNERFQEIIINPEALGEGAEGTIHEVLSPNNYLGYVVKVYKDPKRASLLEEKIKYLIQNKPQLKDKDAIIFPEEIIYNYGNFAGFLMKKAKGIYDLTTLCTLKPSSRLPRNWREKYDRQTPDGMRSRMRLCYNIAAAINQLHRTRKFTFIDIKPENIKVNFDATVSIVDIDSVAISDGFELLFPAEKFTQEYSPVEFKDLNLRADLIDETWDRFSISVIFYKILFGIHPYAGTCKGDYAALNSNEQKIMEGLFPNGTKKEHFEIIPEPHKNFHKAPKKIKKLFLNTFEHGLHLPARRASAEDWCKVFRTAKPSFFEKVRNALTFNTKTEKTKKEKIKPVPSYDAPTSSTAGLIPALVIFLGFTILAVYLFKINEARKLRELDAMYGRVEEHRPTDFIKQIAIYEGHDAVEKLYDDITWVRTNNKFGLINTKRKYLTDIKYDWANDFHSDLAAVRLNGKHGFVDKTGKEVIPLQYDYVSNFRGDFAVAREGKNYYFINRKGIRLIGYQEVGDFHEGLATYKKNGRWGYLNEKGEVQVEAQYDYGYPFSGGRAKVNYYGKYGYLDKQGKLIIPTQFDDAGTFIDGKAKVRIGEDEFMIDEWGRRL